MERRKRRTGEAARTSLEQAIGLRFKQAGEFVEEQAANLSTGGMFIRSRKPHPVGAVFEFEFRLADNRPLIAGKAQVAWVRRRSSYLERPVGMGVRFVELGDEGRRQIAELVAAREEPGGLSPEIEPPVEVDVVLAEEVLAEAVTEDDQAAVTDEAPDPPPDPTEPVPHEPEGEARKATAPQRAAIEPPAEPTPPPDAERPIALPVATVLAAATDEPEKSRRSRRPWILLALVLAVALAATLWRQPSPEAAPSTGALAVAEERVGTVPSPSPAPQAEPQQLQAIESWARAWSEQRVDDYLEAYSVDFTSEGLDRADWERQRRARILAPKWIQVGLAFVEVEETGADASRVSFVQAYESDTYSDVVRKVIEVERVGDDWKIVRETVVP